ncbi:hypothetical protein RLO149_c036780 [Roseobacter litoralis Och 149]|uniref:Uncharacterized protein n=1 Tax=Roseobacter litoralis (strain ATCC 49566 / DSM 6996 / JCM 21268 / NBRC 15278 / OCh 149) TaxID=391595 RepID=F7ZBL4_ROSLO|nr:hypothetical protein RLO149_c036780 [Roseobacter litoralis Och 149]
MWLIALSEFPQAKQSHEMVSQLGNYAKRESRSFRLCQRLLYPAPILTVAKTRKLPEELQCNTLFACVTVSSHIAQNG